MTFTKPIPKTLAELHILQKKLNQVSYLKSAYNQFVKQKRLTEEFMNFLIDFDEPDDLNYNLSDIDPVINTLNRELYNK
jgi:FPC/CPF motif-containing protein YcgG